MVGLAQGLRARFSLVHLTDPHIAGEDQARVRGVDTAARLAGVVESINRLSPAPAFVIITGDFSADGSPAAHRRAAALLRALQVPVRVTLGNHDDPETFRQVMGELGDLLGTETCQAIDIQGWRILLLNSKCPGLKEGFLGPVQRQQMREELAKNPRPPALLFMHHHVLPFSGHAHQASRHEWSGIPFFVTPSAGYQFFKDPTQPRVSPEPPAYRLIAIQGGMFVTEVRPVGPPAEKPTTDPPSPSPRPGG
ncbi:MAG: metallophosphoesterase [candidate division NC10 bacterium]|nr:metallophosphoesterase [candidate division NC10 bacterium]